LERRVQFAAGMMFRTSALLVALSSLIACGAVEQEPKDDDVVAAEQASTGTDTGTDLAYISEFFSAPPAEVGGTIENSATEPECVSTATDGLTYVDVIFDDCLLADGLLYVNGTVHGELAVDALEAIVYNVSTTNLALGASTVSGSWQVRDPFSPSAPMSWDGQTQIVGPYGHVTNLRTTASWINDGVCTTLIELDGTYGLTGVTADNVHRCAGTCADTGSVSITFLGATLSWTYNGNGTATVTGPRGREFVITLACSM
jgi:hypothetical protein